MVHLAFWLFNCTLLLHYVQRDTTLSRSEAIGEYRPLLADLINEIYVFVIRDAERRIDRVLDAAMLDHEAIPGFEEVRFEGEWKFMRALAGSVKGMRDGGASPSPGRRPISQIFGGARDNIPEPGSSPNGAGFGPGHVSHAPPGSPFRVAGDVSPPKSRPSSLINARDTLHNSSPATLLSRPSPRTITSLLTSTLHVLQLYEINPAIVIQALSQVFFWVGCELFNRVLTRRRYLCRSRAMQIRMNVSALEDWARSNALPLAVVNAHLAPLSQLVSWLQCQSALCEFDGLIATMQGLRALNPPQMRRAVHDYRYEVGEGRMSAECIQYLEQLQKDWERRRVDLSISMVEREREHELEVRRHEASRHGVNAGKKKGQSAHHRSGTATQDGSTPDSRSPSPSEDEQENDQHPRDGDWDQDTSVESAATAGAAEEGPGSAVDAAARAAQGSIDALFEAGRSMADYIPPWTAAGGPPGVHGEVAAPAGPVGASETPLGELLNSRDMLPFALPSRTEALVVSPGDAFGFGRGHFTGTGTPSLKSVRAPSPSPFGGASPTFGSRASSPASGSEGGDNASDDGAGSVSGASSRTGASAASRSSLFPDGHGFAAGASWQPVPVLPEGLLEGIDKLMRDVPVNARTPLESRLTAVLSPELERFPSSASSIATSTTRGAGAGASNQGDDHQRDRDRDRRFEKTGNLSPVPPTPDLDGWSETGAESPRPSMGEEEEDAEAAEDVSNLEEVDLGSDLGSPAPESSSMRSASGEYGYGGREIQRGRQGQRIQQGHHARRASGLSGVPARLFLPEGDGVTGNERRLASRMAALSVNASSTAGLGAGVEEEDEGVFTPRGERRMEF